ncbi:MAG: right-handed parallel beta-helix repeat-containing protein [Candidatus Latescibacterota bacterium]
MPRRTMITAVVVVLGFLCFSTAHASVTVSGYAFLADEEDHRDIKVLFEAASPSAETDSAYTNGIGYFQISLESGAYAITYSRERHLPEALPTRIISENTVLDDVILQYGRVVVYLSGNLSGTLSSGDVCIVTGDITVRSGDTLIIEPGVTVKFDGFYAFEINGLLKAVGTETDSILFTSNQPTPQPRDWTWIRFNGSADDSSRVAYCRIEYAQSGIYCYFSSPTITNNTITGNNTGISCSSSSPTITDNTIAANGGYGIFCNSSSPTLTDNTITGNGVGGIYCWGNSSPTITNNTITGNNENGIYCESSSPTITNNTITGNSENGILCSSSSPTITNNTITGNSGHGIYCDYKSSPTITNNTITENGENGIYCFYHSSPIVTDNTITGNSEDGIRCDFSSPTITNNAITGNGFLGISCDSKSSPNITNNTITGNGEIGIYCYFSSPTIINNAIMGNGLLGISCDNKSSPTITNNTITENSGRGVSCLDNSSPTITHNTITGNSNEGIHCYSSSPTITSNIVIENYRGIYCEDNSFPSITYNDVWSNSSGNFVDCPDYVGDLITVNANGDSCDTYYNIILDPVFMDPENGDICLQWGSPCIDAGDPTFPFDPDTTVADMGAVPFDQRLRDIISPSVPQNLSAVAGASMVTLTFSANPDTEGVAFYVVYRDMMASPADSIAVVVTPNTTYLDLDVEIGKTYYYRITAVDSAGNESEYSNEVSATLFITPEPPSNLQAFDTPDDQGHSITLTWTKSPDDGAGWGVVSYYRIYRSRSSELTDPIPISAFPWSACPDTFEFSPGSCPGLDSLMAMEVNHTILIDSVAAGITEYVDAYVPVNGVHYYYWLDAVATNGGMSAKVVARFVQTDVNEETTVSLPQKYLLY